MAEPKKNLPRINILNAPPPYDEFEGEEANRSDYFYFVDGDGRPCADRTPFRPDARDFELVNAWWLCEAATLAYSAPEQAEPIFENKALFERVEFLSTGGGSQCFVASNEDFAVVAFRGSELTPREDNSHDFSEILKDWLRDFDIRPSNSVPGATVHRGFADGVKELWEGQRLGDLIAALPSRKVWFTGHSLGAALATLAAARALASEGGRLDGLYTFGSPRVGDAVFAQNFTRMLAGKGLTYYRFVNGDDVVTTVPLTSAPPNAITFKHAGTLKHIDGGGHIREDRTLFDELMGRARAILPVGAGGHLDHLFNGIPKAVEDHVPTLYSAHIWNAL